MSCRHHAGTLRNRHIRDLPPLAQFGTNKPHWWGIQDTPSQFTSRRNRYLGFCKLWRTPISLRLSDEVELSLELARQRLADLPQPLELATEHILLGLAAADHEVAAWLRQQGLDPDALEAEIHRLYGRERDEAKGVGWALPAMDRRVGQGREDTGGTSQTGQPLLDALSAGSVKAATEVPPSPRLACPTLQVGENGDIAVLRVLDAAANRAREGLRVVEDYVRFVLDDRHLTGLCKQLRHDLTDGPGSNLPSGIALPPGKRRPTWARR